MADRAGSHTHLPSAGLVQHFIRRANDKDRRNVGDRLLPGMAETLISSLSQLPNLNVKARSSVFRYKGKETNPQTVGKELNVQAVLNGRVAQRGDRLTLTLELVDVPSPRPLSPLRNPRKPA